MNLRKEYLNRSIFAENEDHFDPYRYPDRPLGSRELYKGLILSNPSILIFPIDFNRNLILPNSIKYSKEEKLMITTHNININDTIYIDKTNAINLAYDKIHLSSPDLVNCYYKNSMKEIHLSADNISHFCKVDKIPSSLTIKLWKNKENSYAPIESPDFIHKLYFN